MLCVALALVSLSPFLSLPFLFDTFLYSTVPFNLKSTEINLIYFFILILPVAVADPGAGLSRSVHAQIARTWCMIRNAMAMLCMRVVLDPTKRVERQLSANKRRRAETD